MTQDVCAAEAAEVQNRSINSLTPRHLTHPHVMSRTYRPAADDVLGSVQRVMLGADAEHRVGEYVGCRMRLTVEVVCRRIPDALHKLYLVVVSRKTGRRCLFLRHAPLAWRDGCSDSIKKEYQKAVVDFELNIDTACHEKRQMLNGEETPWGPVSHAYLVTFGGYDMFIYRKHVLDGIAQIKSWTTEDIPKKLARLIQKEDHFFGKPTALSFDRIVNDGHLVTLLSDKLCFAENCGKKAFLRCGECRVAMYCSKKCQKSDWRTRHKHICGDPGTSVTQCGPVPMLDLLMSFREQI